VESHQPTRLDITAASKKKLRVRSSGCTDPRILDLGNKWSEVVSSTPRPLYPSSGKLVGPQNWSGSAPRTTKLQAADLEQPRPMFTQPGPLGLDQAEKLSTQACVRKVQGSNLGQDTTCLIKRSS
jgi:hypothetical protein